MSETRVDIIRRVIISNYKGVSITKDEYIQLVNTTMRLLSELIENIKEG